MFDEPPSGSASQEDRKNLNSLRVIGMAVVIFLLEALNLFGASKLYRSESSRGDSVGTAGAAALIEKYRD
jgi:hypothetical protein